MLSSCGNRKFLKSHSESAEKPRKRVFDEKMLVKNKLNFAKQNYKIQEDYDNLWYELSTVIRQNPDRSVIRGFRQWVYHLNDTLAIPYKWNADSVKILPDTVRRKSNKLQNWLHTKVGVRPVVLDTALTRQTAENMQLFLNQKAYFNAKVTYDIFTRNHKAWVTYNIKTGMPILADSVFFYSKDTVIQAILEDVKGLSVIQPRTPISMANLEAEKDRIRQVIRNRGYYDFTRDYVVFQADTVNARKVAAKKKKLFSSETEQGEPRANIYVEILPYSDTSIVHPKYTIANVYITPNEYILKAHQKRRIKKDSFFIVERTLKDRDKQVLLKGDDVMLPGDSILSEREVNGRKIRWVKRSVPRFKKITLTDRADMLPEDRLVHIILRKKIKNKDGTPVSIKEKRKKYFIRDKVISDAVVVKAGDLYNSEQTKQSVRNVNKLAVFRAPRVDYVPSRSGKEGELDCLVKMQQGKKQEWKGTVDLNNNNTSSYGSGIGIAGSFSYRNKNIFKGAEIFEVSAQGGLDFRVTGPDTNRAGNFFEQAVNLFDVSLETNLSFPRFLGLKFIERAFGMKNARTKVALGYRYLQQSSDFRISSFYTKMGYEWSRGNQHTFTWNPALISLTLEPVLNPTFAELLRQNNLALYNSLSVSYLIPSMDFTYSFRTPEPKAKGGSWVFKSSFEIAGNLLYLLDQVIEPDQKMQFFGVDYSQFFRTDLDLRYSFKLSKRHSIVSRLMLGIIIPYGNSEGTEVPFTKRFALGGPNSMRAWNLRYLGPGNQPSVTGAEFQVGDLRMEFNTEYRFMFNSWIGGALFTDIGNIWLLHSSTAFSGIPNQQPRTGAISSKFYEQLAIGAGVGLRVDVSFFIFRLDFAVQLRDPQGYRLKPDGTVQYWNFDPFVLTNRHKFVIAIGYPF